MVGFVTFTKRQVTLGELVPGSLLSIVLNPQSGCQNRSQQPKTVCYQGAEAPDSSFILAVYHAIAIASVVKKVRREKSLQ
jgi:hypothetical protein